MTKPNTIPEKFITDTRKDPKYWEEVQKETSKHSVEVPEQFYDLLGIAIEHHDSPFAEISRDLHISPNEYCNWSKGDKPTNVGELMRAASFILSLKPTIFGKANRLNFYNYADIVNVASHVTEDALKAQLTAQDTVLQSWFNRSKIARV